MRPELLYHPVIVKLVPESLIIIFRYRILEYFFAFTTNLVGKLVNHRLELTFSFPCLSRIRDYEKGCSGKIFFIKLYFKFFEELIHLDLPFLDQLVLRSASSGFFESLLFK